MIGIIAGLLKPVVGGVVDYVTKGQDIRAAEKENISRLLRDEKSNNHAWEMAVLSDKDKWLRRVCFVIFIFPMIYSWIDPVAVQTYFDITLKTLPAWYIEIIFALVGSIFGISALKNTLPALVGGISKALRN